MEEHDGIAGYHRHADNTIERWKAQAIKQGFPIACTNCTKPACCSQQVMAYDAEILQIAEFVRERTELHSGFRRWANEYLRLTWEQQRTFSTTFELQMYCPLLVDGQCAAYDIRPLVCRGYVVFEEDEGPCNDLDPTCKPVKQMDARPLHQPMFSTGSRPYLMQLAVAAILWPNERVGKKSVKLLGKLARDYPKRMAELAEKNAEIQKRMGPVSSEG